MGRWADRRNDRFLQTTGFFLNETWTILIRKRKQNKLVLFCCSLSPILKSVILESA